jgi:hypothetical protein
VKEALFFGVLLVVAPVSSINPGTRPASYHGLGERLPPFRRASADLLFETVDRVLRTRRARAA